MLEPIRDIAARSPLVAELRLSMLDQAWRIAIAAHQGQTDKASDCYLYHVARVAASLRTVQEQVVGLLHDVLEDSPDSGAWYAIIQQEFPYAIVEALEALCKREDEPYTDYLDRVKACPLALRVKFADLADNSNPDRLAKLHPRVAARLVLKYRNAKAYLEA